MLISLKHIRFTSAKRSDMRTSNTTIDLQKFARSYFLCWKGYSVSLFIVLAELRCNWESIEGMSLEDREL